jgi:PAS domain S-box-containing protein
MKAVAKEKRRVAYTLVLSFAILALGMVVGGTFYYRNYERQFRAGIEQQLSTIAELKVIELVEYRKERWGDAATFFSNAAFSGLVRRFLNHPEDAEAQQQIQEWAVKYMATDQYDMVCLLDAQGVVRMSVPTGRPPISSVVSQRIPEVLRSGQVTFQDFTRNEHNQRIYLTLLVPILDGPDHSQALAVLALRIDPETYLYPFISRWPAPSRTAETLLVRRDGNEAVFLNELKFQTNTALNLRNSLENTNVIAVKAVLGQKGIVEGTDYRGVPVIAYVCAVPDSPWFMVARMDTAEVYASLHERLWTLILLVSALVLCSGLGATAIWRHQHAQLYKKQYQMAEALRESEERLHSHTENSPLAVVEWNADLIITRWTGAAEKIFGWSAEEAIGKPITELPGICEEDLPIVQRAIQQLADGASKHVFSSNRNRTRNGQVIHCEWHNSVLHDAGGEIISVMSQVLDITERKQAEAALQENRHRLAEANDMLQLVMDTIPVRIFWKNKDSVYLGCNRLLAEDAGRKSSEDVVGETDYTLSWREQAELYRKDDMEVMRSGNSKLGYEEPQTTPEGKQIWLRTSKVPLRDINNRIVGILGTYEDITTHKQAEESLANERALLRTLVDHLPAAIYLKDIAGRKTLANRVELGYMGATSEAEVLGKTDFDFFPPEQAAVYQANDQEVIRNGQPRINHESSFTKPDGSVIYLSGSTVPLRDAAGRVIGLAGINYDITDRKRAEERLLRVITQTRCILYSGHVTGPEGWRKRALEPVSPFHWDTPVVNEQTAQKVVPLELAAGESYLQAWERSWNRANAAQMNWNSGNAFLNDLPFYRNEFRCTDKHGVGHWMQEFVTVQKLAENRWQIFSIATDISDLKRVETELRRNETGLQAILESTADGILAVDNKGKVIKANRRFAELWQIPQSLMDAGDDRALLEFVLKQLSDPDAFLKKELSLYNTDAVEMDTLAFKDGRIFERYYFPMMMEGVVIGRVWSFRDITERKQAAQRVADALNFNQTVLRASPVGIVVFKAAGPCISANEAIGQIIGGACEEVLKQNFRQLESWKDSGMLAAAETALAAQTERKLETQIVTTFGRKAWFSCRFVPFLYEGEPHLLLIVSDITERKRQENELREKNSELERFTYTVSHDLKSPLVTVKTFLGYLEQDMARPDMERVKQDVAYMHTATEKMGQLLDELLNLARVGRKKNPAARVAFRELAQEALQLVAGRISTGGVKVQVADAVVTLEGDRPRLMEIWQNLVENACKFMGNQPQPQVEIGVEKRDPETVFFVRDNGAGIDPRHQAKVFGLFEQLNSRGEGTGMGLALVKRIVELYEGRIWVESAGPGQGANFLFTLPGAVIIEPEQSS